MWLQFQRSRVINGVKERVADPTKRLQVSPLGELYGDALKIEAFLKNRTEATEANSLLCARLMSRDEYRQKSIEYLAWKRGISAEQMRQDILLGNAEHLTPQECWEVGSGD